MSKPRYPSAAWTAHHGPWAIVTGASDGLGRAFANTLAARGFKLVLVARRAELLAALAHDLEQGHGADVQCLAIDLTRVDAVAELDRQTADLDVGLVVAAAGYGSLGELLDLDLQSEADMVKLNASAVLEMAHRFGRRMRARGRGGLVLFSSVVAFQGTPLLANYAATKAYVQTFAEALSVEWQRLGLPVLSCAPGPVATGFARRAGMSVGNAARAVDLIEPCLKALGHQTTVRPGPLAKLLGYGLMTLPRVLRTRVMLNVMRGMQGGKSARGQS